MKLFKINTDDYFYYVCGIDEFEAIDEFKSIIGSDHISCKEIPESEWDKITFVDCENLMGDSSEELSVKDVMTQNYACLIGTNDEDFID